jgi:hypothetical protein
MEITFNLKDVFGIFMHILDSLLLQFGVKNESLIYARWLAISVSIYFTYKVIKYIITHTIKTLQFALKYSLLIGLVAVAYTQL